MNRGMRIAIIRHLISVVIVVTLCAIYYKSTGRVFVWFFLPISLIPIMITFWDNYWQQKENAKTDLKNDNKLDMSNAEERNKK